MPAIDINATSTLVLWASFGLSFVFGAIAQKTHFCTMGAVSDVINMGDWTRMRQWALAIGVATVGFGLLAYSGKIDPTKSIHFSQRWMWLSGLVGGGLFGIGMTLASGCGSKTLVRIGGGSLKALIVFMVIGISGFATMKGVTAVLRVATVDQVGTELPVGSNLPSLLTGWVGAELSLAWLVCSVIVGAGLIAWAVLGKSFVQFDNLLAGVGLGLVLTAMWWVSGHLGYVAEHPNTLEEVFLTTTSGRMEALSFVAPISYTLDWLMFFSDKNKVITMGLASVAGVIAGSACVALALRRFRWEAFGSTEDVANHLVGAVLMGIGGVTAMGCTVGQGLSGLSTLSLTSFTAVAGILIGGVMGLKYQAWRLESMI